MSNNCRITTYDTNRDAAENQQATKRACLLQIPLQIDGSGSIPITESMEISALDLMDAYDMSPDENITAHSWHNSLREARYPASQGLVGAVGKFLCFRFGSIMKYRGLATMSRV